MKQHPFVTSVLRQFTLYRSLGEKTIEKMTQEQLHAVPAPGSNSIAVIVRHLHGNMLSRWTDFLTSDGEKAWRKRDAEFEERREEKSSLIEKWREGWKKMSDTIETLTEDDLARTVLIRGEAMSAMEAIHRQLAHYAYHVGQIVYAGKMLAGNAWESLSIPKKK